MVSDNMGIAFIKILTLSLWDLKLSQSFGSKGDNFDFNFVPMGFETNLDLASWEQDKYFNFVPMGFETRDI